MKELEPEAAWGCPSLLTNLICPGALSLIPAQLASSRNTTFWKPLSRAPLKLPSKLGRYLIFLGAPAYSSGSLWQRRSHGQHGPTCDTTVSLIWSVRLALSDSSGSQAFLAWRTGPCITCRATAGHMNDSPVGVSSAFRDRRGRAWQGMASNIRSHARPTSIREISISRPSLASNFLYVDEIVCSLPSHSPFYPIS